MSSRDVRIDSEGRERCWTCGGVTFRELSSLLGKAERDPGKRWCTYRCVCRDDDRCTLARRGDADSVHRRRAAASCGLVVAELRRASRGPCPRRHDGGVRGPSTGSSPCRWHDPQVKDRCLCPAGPTVHRKWLLSGQPSDSSAQVDVQHRNGDGTGGNADAVSWALRGAHEAGGVGVRPSATNKPQYLVISRDERVEACRARRGPRATEASGLPYRRRFVAMHQIGRTRKLFKRCRDVVN
jgi:hypothetical protein